MNQADELLTAGKIAEKLAVPPAKIKKAITTLNIQPDNVKGGCNYYNTATIAKIKKGLD
ncbi:MAG: hypothetical protein HW421_2996 [Ignavibacteria bacterium]|nr:hypothetical protein [Ignavibacteria bacterium]